MAGLMKILQVERVIPNLINGRSIKRFLADLELNRKHNRSDEQNGINSTSHAWDVELKE